MAGDFFDKMPLQYKAFGSFAGWLGAQFMSAHPNLVPSWAIDLAPFLIAIFLASFMWYSLNYWREYRGKPRLNIDPGHVVVFALAVALAAAAYGQFFHKPPIAPMQAATAPDPDKASAQAQIDRLTRIAFVTDTLKRFEEVQAQLEDAANSRFKQLGKNHWPGQSLVLLEWFRLVDELTKLYKDYSGKDVDLKAAPNFAQNQMRRVAGEEAMPNEEQKVEYRKFSDQVMTAGLKIPMLRGEMVQELQSLKSQAYRTLLGGSGEK